MGITDWLAGCGGCGCRPGVIHLVRKGDAIVLLRGGRIGRYRRREAEVGNDRRTHLGAISAASVLIQRCKMYILAEFRSGQRVVRDSHCRVSDILVLTCGDRHASTGRDQAAGLIKRAVANVCRSIWPGILYIMMEGNNLAGYHRTVRNSRMSRERICRRSLQRAQCAHRVSTGIADLIRYSSAV